MRAAKAESRELKLRAFTLHLDPATGRFDDAALQRLSAEHEVLSVRTPVRSPGHAVRPAGQRA